MWPVLIAKEKGILRKNGMQDVEFVFIEGGSRGVAALMAGDVQLMQMGGSAAVQAILNGAPLLILSSITNVLFFDLVTSKDILKPSDLKGKRSPLAGSGARRISQHDCSLAAGVFPQKNSHCYRLEVTRPDLWL